MYKHTQRSWSGGQIDRELMGRQDLQKYFTGASKLQNLLVRRQGNLAKRRGTDEAATLAGLLGQNGAGGADIPLRSPRLFPLVSSREQGYHVLIANRRAYLCSRKGVRSVSYGWLRSVAPYDGTVSYSGRASVGSDYAYMIGPDGYDTLQEAIAAAQDGDVIKVGRDDSFAETVSFATVGTITLDLNGHVLSSTLSDDTAHGRAFLVSGAQTTLVIEDSAGGGTITQPQPVCAHLLAATAGAKIVVNDGRVLARARNSTAATGNSVKWRAAVWLSAGARYEGNGGVVANEGNVPTWDSEVEMYECPPNALFYLAPGTHAADTIGISGGLYRGGYWFDLHDWSGDLSSSAIFLATSANDSAKTATVSISGGIVAVYSAGGTLTDGECDDNIVITAKIQVTGGALLGWGNDYEVVSNVRSESTAGSTEGYETSVASGSVLNSAGDSVWIPTVSAGLGRYEEVWGCHPAAEGDYHADWTCDDDHWATPAPESGAPTAVDVRPYYVDVPWDDSELAELNFCQSGDTVFFAHRSHPPARISFDPASVTLEYSLVPFAAPWLPPVLSSIDMSEINKTTSTCSSGSSKSSRSTTTTSYDRSQGTKTVSVIGGASGDTATTTTSYPPKRTVSYCVSYVKDGVESPPSAPRSATYLAPWQEGEKITVKFNKGGNDGQPDEYRIYKKQGTEFGLIGTVRNNSTIETSPTITLADAAGAVARGSFSAWPGEGAARTATPFTTPEAEETRGRSVSGVCEGWNARFDGARGEVTCWPGLGGVTTPQAVFAFGKNSGVSIATVVVQVDAHSLRYEELEDGTVDVFDDITLSGKTFTCKMSTLKADGDSGSTLTATATLAPVTVTGKDGTQTTAYDGTVTHYLGNFPSDIGHAAIAAAAASAGLKPRGKTFSFSSDVGSLQTRNVAITAKSGQGRTCDLVLAAVKFTPKASIATSFDDDYITPDMSQTPVSAEYPFQGTGNYPGCVGVHQQRLVFASTRRDPSSIRMSATGDLYTFSPHSSIREDDPISFSIAATEFPDVNHLVVTRDILLLADGGEWKVAPASGNVLSYKTITSSLQGRVGSSRRVRPMAIGDEIVFADASEMALLATRYNYASDGYESTNLTVLSANLFNGNRIVQAAYEQFPDSRLKCALADGHVAVMVYMPEHEVTAWSLCVLGGGALAKGVTCSRAIVGNTSDVMLLVSQGGALRLWSVRPDLPDMTVRAQACMDGCRVLSGTDAAAAWPDGWTAIDALTAATYASKAALQAADGYAARSYVVGLRFPSELVTVRPEPPQQGTIQFEIKNAKDVEVRVLDGGSWRAAPFGFVDHAVYAQRVDVRPAATGGAIALDTADHTLLLSGANSGDGRVQVKSDDPWPLSILSLSTNYEIQPLSNSEG